MDPEHATYLTAQRLARHLSGHLQSCGCEQCTLYGKLLGSDTGLQKAITHIYHSPGGTEPLEALTGETL